MTTDITPFEAGARIAECDGTRRFRLFAQRRTPVIELLRRYRIGSFVIGFVCGLAVVLAAMTITEMMR
jgi:hypothetical protein